MSAAEKLPCEKTRLTAMRGAPQAAPVSGQERADKLRLPICRETDCDRAEGKVVTPERLAKGMSWQQYLKTSAPREFVFNYEETAER
jgi:hypothetical protein